MNFKQLKPLTLVNGIAYYSGEYPTDGKLLIMGFFHHPDTEADCKHWIAYHGEKYVGRFDSFVSVCDAVDQDC